jgi:hypothetical protein
MNKKFINIQNHGEHPLKIRDTELYQQEYVQSFVEKWDELIDWDARSDSEGQFFIDILKARDKQKILDVATGTGFHSVQLLNAGFIRENQPLIKGGATTKVTAPRSIILYSVFSL